MVLSRPLSTLTFGDESHARSIMLLSAAVLFAVISGGQYALVQGLRRIADLARISVIGGLLGTLFSIPAVFFFGERGVVMYLVFVAATGVLTSWWYARKVKVEPVSMSLGAVSSEAGALLKLGIVFVSSAFMSMGAAFLIRVMVSRKMGVEAVGLYQSAWTIAGLYIGFVLQAMGADFYPRLTESAKDPDRCNRLINEQIEVSLLLVGPGVLATLTFAPLVIGLFYSAKFAPAVGAPALAMPRHVPPDCFLAAGFSYAGEGEGRDIFLHRAGCQPGAFGAGLVLYQVVWPPGLWGCLCWVVCVLLPPGLPGRAPPHRLPLRRGQPSHRFGDRRKFRGVEQPDDQRGEGKRSQHARPDEQERNLDLFVDEPITGPDPWRSP